MNKTLFDTDIFSEVLRAVNATVVANARTYRQAYGRLTLSVITVMEMVKGLQKVQRPQKIGSLPLTSAPRSCWNSASLPPRRRVAFEATSNAPDNPSAWPIR